MSTFELLVRTMVLFSPAAGCQPLVGGQWVQHWYMSPTVDQTTGMYAFDEHSARMDGLASTLAYRWGGF
jgi:hypothetical protein